MKSLKLILPSVFLCAGCCHKPTPQDNPPPSPKTTSTEEKKNEDDLSPRRRYFPTRARTQSLQGDPRPPSH